MKWLRSLWSSTFSKFIGSVKLGQPVPESNLVSDEKSSASHPAQTYVPSSLVWTSSPVNGRSVP
jgi:hypothetical protein